MKKLAIGKTAPECRATLQDGRPFKTSDLKGSRTILYFYPQDNTPTCTEEACNLRDNFTALEKHGFRVIGISPDSEKKHRNFIKKFSLPFELVADIQKEFVRGFGVWGEKTTFGRTYDGVHRTTFVLDERTVVVQRIDDVKSKDHARQIMQELGLKK